MWYASFAIVVVLPVPFTPTNITMNGRGLFSMRPKKSIGGADNARVIASRQAASNPCSRPTPFQMRLPPRASAVRAREARPDCIGRLGDGLDSCGEPLDLSIHLIVDEEVRADRDERLVDVLRLGDQERIRADRHEDFGGLPRFLVPHERFARPHVLLEGDADDLLLLGQRLDLRPVLIEDRDPPSEFGLAGAHARASSAYRTAWSSTWSAGTSATVAIEMYLRGTPCWLPRTERSFSRAATSSAAASSFEKGCHRRPMRKRPLIRNAFMGRRARGCAT